MARHSDGARSPLAALGAGGERCDGVPLIEQ
jgi:hypothetical protein